MDALVALINASSDKLAFVGGLILELVTVFCKKPIQLGSVSLPSIDRTGRIISGVIGTLLVGWALFVWTATSDVGLLSVKPKPESEVLQQDLPKQVRLSTGEEIGVLVHSIKSRGPSRIVTFRLDNITRQVLGREISYNSLVGSIGRNRIIWEESITQGGTYRFTYRNQTYTVRVDRVLWYAFGLDYVVITIE